jgi:type IV pilus biogenesis protein CpaD/CtpE
MFDVSNINPDHRIQIIQGPSGSVAVPPNCISWYDSDWGHPLSNNPWPSYGCAQARNLAAQVEKPENLKELGEMSAADPIVESGAIARYQAGKTTPLIDPKKDYPIEIKKMEDKRVGGPPKE